MPPRKARVPADAAQVAARRVQSASTDVKARLPRGKSAVDTGDGLCAPFAGRQFRLSETIGLMPLMMWAASAEDVDKTSMTQLTALYRVLQDLVHPDDWAEFQAHACAVKAGDEDFSAFQNAATEAITARPTEARETS